VSGDNLIPDEDIALLPSPSLLSLPPKGVTWEDANDSQLIEACILGEERAWTALINRYSRLVYTIPLRFGFSKMVADEIFQETCLILLESLETLRETERVRAWLVTVCRRVSIQHMRQKKEVQSLDAINLDGRHLDGRHLDGRDPPLDAELIQLEQQHIVQEALTKLPARCQQLIKALFFSHPPASYEEIAGQLNISTGSVGPTRSRCLEKLEQEITKATQS
jgi:RNA polymerase sigma factor (sigma-70 family)